MIERMRSKENISIVRHRRINGPDNVLGVSGLVVAKLENDRAGVRLIEGHNLITSAGDVHYAERATTKTPTDTFQLLHLTTSTSPAVAKDFVYGDISAYIAGSTAVVETGYPAQGDTDADNSGSGNAVVTWKFTYTKASFSSGVYGGVITTTGPTSGSNALSQFVFATTFTKTTDDTLTVFVNHTMLGTT